MQISRQWMTAINTSGNGVTQPACHRPAAPALTSRSPDASSHSPYYQILFMPAAILGTCGMF